MYDTLKLYGTGAPVWIDNALNPERGQRGLWQPLTLPVKKQ